MCQQEVSYVARGKVEVVPIVQPGEIAMAFQKTTPRDTYMKQRKQIELIGIEGLNAVLELASQSLRRPVGNRLGRVLVQASSRELERERSERQEELGAVERNELGKVAGLPGEVGSPVTLPIRRFFCGVVYRISDVEIGCVDSRASDGEHLILNAFEDGRPDIVASRVPWVERFDETVLPSRRARIGDQPDGEGSGAGGSVHDARDSKGVVSSIAGLTQTKQIDFFRPFRKVRRGF
ncbi:MAG: hypothetical protein OXU42_07860 [Deltaproteobacteria bacterium]|nr:hypothetical protein [Deltaproteobacteria bacterium]